MVGTKATTTPKRNFEMDSIQTTVVSKIVSDKEAKAARSEITPGIYPVDFTIRYHGGMKVGQDYDRPATTSIPWLEVTSLIREAYRVVLEALLAKLDGGGTVSRGDIVDIMESGPLASDFAVKVIRQALEDKVKATGKLKDVVELEAAVDALLADFSAQLPRQKVPGRVSLDVKADVVGVPQGMTAAEIASALNPQPQTV